MANKRLTIILATLLLGGGVGSQLMTERSDQARPDDYRRVLLVETEDESGRFAGTFVVAGTRRVTRAIPSKPLPVEEALAWGRAAAEMVVLQVGGVQYSAGLDPESGLEPWVDGTEVRVRRSYEPPGPPVSYFRLAVKATDGKPLNPAIVERLRADPGIREVDVKSPKLVEVSAKSGDAHVFDYVDEIVGRVPLSERTPDLPYSATRTIVLIGPDTR